MSALFPPNRYVHLQLTRVGTQAPRRKRPGGGKLPSRVPGEHGLQLGSAVQGVLAARAARTRPAGIDPELVLRVHLAPGSHVSADEWMRSGFTVLGSQTDDVILLFANDQELSEFRRRIVAYSAGIREEDESQRYRWIAAVDSISEWGPEDRRGRTLRGMDLRTATDMTLDIELWYPGDLIRSRQRIAALSQLLADRGGSLIDSYIGIGQSLLLTRARLSSVTLEELLTWDIVFSVEVPPKPEFSVTQTRPLTTSDFSPIQLPPDDAPGICVLDSGIAAGHSLLGPAVGDTTAVPLSLGTPTDVQGHGTKVAGIALYGNVQACIERRLFQPEHWIFSVRVTNEHNEFDEVELIERQMQDAIEYAHSTWECRVFNISLGDRTRPFDGSRVSTWAATLDELARRLDIVIVVSAGNYRFISEDTTRDDSPWAGYPNYLFQDEARLLSPSEAANVLTVGSLARPGTSYRSERYPTDVNYQSIARGYEPSPFTRIGPGIEGAIKPELCEIGGNFAIDLRTGNRDEKDSGVACVTLSREFASGNLFEFDSGTSFAAPAVAYGAARLLDSFPQASANLIRSLLASSAQVPQETHNLLGDIGKTRRVCGYGLPHVEAALTSSDERVVLIAEETLGADQFHVFEVPLPEDFRYVSGSRFISVTLAFDPPTRHTRLDYIGTAMDFRLMRGLDIDTVARAFAQRPRGNDNEPAVPNSAKCSMIPGPQARKGGTLQRAIHPVRHNPKLEYGDTYYLAVQCYKGWAGDEFYPQRYALVVTLEHARQGVRLYDQIRLRTRNVQQVRQRARS